MKDALRESVNQSCRRVWVRLAAWKSVRPALKTERTMQDASFAL